jgi:hypothetical protein
MRGQTKNFQNALQTSPLPYVCISTQKHFGNMLRNIQIAEEEKSAVFAIVLIYGSATHTSG